MKSIAPPICLQRSPSLGWPAATGTSRAGPRCRRTRSPCPAPRSRPTPHPAGRPSLAAPFKLMGQSVVRQAAGQPARRQSARQPGSPPGSQAARERSKESRQAPAEQGKPCYPCSIAGLVVEQRAGHGRCAWRCGRRRHGSAPPPPIMRAAGMGGAGGRAGGKPAAMRTRWGRRACRPAAGFR